MSTSTWVRTTVAASIAGAGLTLGGVGLASAADNERPVDHGEVHAVRDAHFADFAKALGVSQAKLKSALDALRNDLKPPKPPAKGQAPTPPTDAQIAAREAKFAAALAQKLGLSEDKVAKVLKDQRDAALSDGRDRLKTRLDAAVTAGKLTAADEASVLKAFDAGVLGGPVGGPVGGPGGGPGFGPGSGHAFGHGPR